MIANDLITALNDLKWIYSDPIVEMVYARTKKLNLGYEELLQLGIKCPRKPNSKKLISAIYDLIDDSQKAAYKPYEVINLDCVDNEYHKEYYKEMLEKSIKYGFIIPTLLISIDNIGEYANRLKGLISNPIYEIAWLWLCMKEYEHSLPIPLYVNYPQLWDYCGVEYE